MVKNMSELFVDDNLPSVLSQDEIYELFYQMNNGCIEFRNKIINTNIRLVIDYVVKKFKDSIYDQKELISVGMIGLINAVDTYRVELGYKFSTYATKCIKNEILLFIRNDNKNKFNVSLDEYIKMYDDNDIISYKDNLCNDNVLLEDMVIKNQMINLMNQKLNILSEREIEILKLYFGFYGEKLSQRQVAKVINLSCAAVNNIIHKALEKLNREMTKNKLKIYTR